MHSAVVVGKAHIKTQISYKYYVSGSALYTSPKSKSTLTTVLLPEEGTISDSLINY